MEQPRSRVVIVGGGVAGLEAALALHDLAADRLEITLLAPGREFVYRPLLVAEPFGVAQAARVDVGRILADTGAAFHLGTLGAVDPAAGHVLTDEGAALEYDALLVALGARAVPVVPGAITFGGSEDRARFSELLGALGRRSHRRVAFVVPAQATWTIAAYELALLTAAERDARNLVGVELALVTPEREPLGVLGSPAAALVSGRLAAAGIALHTAASAERAEPGRLLLADGAQLEADDVVALPGLEVPRLPGMPQQEHGFIRTDTAMQVAGLERVWAAGDVTAFPIKQGGLAAQQADAAARAIAARAGAHVPTQPFQPVLRAALLGGGETAYMRNRIGIADPAVGLADSPLWWPPGKLAAGRLSPYLAGEGAGGLVDLEADPMGAAPSGLSLILAAADADAEAGDFAGALEWTALAEELNLAIPARYVALRDEWARRLGREAPGGEAGDRIGGRFPSADAALSDLQRRIGWLREMEARTTGEMSAHLRHLEAGMEDLRARSRETTGRAPGRGRASKRRAQARPD